MCILFMALEVHPDYPLILCANRDEFHQRPTAPAHVWPGSDIVAGQDLLAGGTWLGLNQQGDIAALTNLRSPANHSDNRLSRGELIPRYLTHPEAFPHWLTSHAEQYNPFNLVYGRGNDFYCFNSLQQSLVKLTRGCHAISNGALDDIWPKMAKGQQALETMACAGLIDEEQLLAIMHDESIPDDDSLPNTGVSLEWERRLASIFICHPQYGTRSTSILLRHRSGQLNFCEVRYNSAGKNIGTERFTIGAHG